MTVLVLAEELDSSADRIVSLLSTRGVPVFRCDTGWFPHFLSLAAELTAEGWCGVLRTPHHRVDLTEVQSVWYRSPTAFRFSDSPTNWPALTNCPTHGTRRFAPCPDTSSCPDTTNKTTPAFPGLGKTTSVLAFAKQFHLREIAENGAFTKDGHERWPVCRSG